MLAKFHEILHSLIAGTRKAPLEIFWVRYLSKFYKNVSCYANTHDSSMSNRCVYTQLNCSIYQNKKKTLKCRFVETSYSIVVRDGETTQPMILFKWFLNGCQI